MSNINSLVPFSELDVERRKEIAMMGNKASIEARRRKRQEIEKAKIEAKAKSELLSEICAELKRESAELLRLSMANRNKG